MTFQLQEAAVAVVLKKFPMPVETLHISVETYRMPVEAMRMLVEMFTVAVQTSRRPVEILFMPVETLRMLVETFPGLVEALKKLVYKFPKAVQKLFKTYAECVLLSPGLGMKLKKVVARLSRATTLLPNYIQPLHDKTRKRFNTNCL